MKNHALIFLLVVAPLLASCSARSLPVVDDPSSLRKDCISLYQRFPCSEDKTNMVGVGYYERHIPTSAWPASVRALHPFQVTDDKYGVYIWISHDSRMPQQDYGSTGYFVRGNPKLVPPRIAHGGGGRFDLNASAYDGIDTFYLPGAVL